MDTKFVGRRFVGRFGDQATYVPPRGLFRMQEFRGQGISSVSLFEAGNKYPGVSRRSLSCILSETLSSKLDHYFPMGICGGHLRDGAFAGREDVKKSIWLEFRVNPNVYRSPSGRL